MKRSLLGMLSSLSIFLTSCLPLNTTTTYTSTIYSQDKDGQWEELMRTTKLTRNNLSGISDVTEERTFHRILPKGDTTRNWVEKEIKGYSGASWSGPNFNTEIRPYEKELP